jgi:hypothetical protein
MGFHLTNIRHKALIKSSIIHVLVPVNYFKVGAGARFLLLGLWMLLSPGDK